MDLERSIFVSAGAARLEGNLHLPPQASGVVLFAHGSGSSRMSPRNRFVAEILSKGALGTLLLDLLTVEEEEQDARTGHLRFDIRFLADRLAGATRWLRNQAGTRDLPIGCFGASTGAAAALVAAAEFPAAVSAVVSRGGRPDLAGPALRAVKAPTLLIVGGDDHPVLEWNQDSLQQLQCEKRIEIVPGATHLFEERGALDRVAQLAREWFRLHLVA